MRVERWGYLPLDPVLIFAEAAKSLVKVTNRTIIAIQNADTPEIFVSSSQFLTISNSSIDSRIAIVCDGLIYGVSPGLND